MECCNACLAYIEISNPLCSALVALRDVGAYCAVDALENALIELFAEGGVLYYRVGCVEKLSLAAAGQAIAGKHII